MADDPRDDTREKIITDWCPDYSEAGRRTLVAELDRADPLRRFLLADEDRAVNAVQRQVAEDGHLVSRRDVGFVLAALREVAGL